MNYVCQCQVYRQKSPNAPISLFRFSVQHLSSFVLVCYWLLVVEALIGLQRKSIRTFLGWKIYISRANGHQEWHSCRCFGPAGPLEHSRAGCVSWALRPSGSKTCLRHSIVHRETTNSISSLRAYKLNPDTCARHFPW